MALPVAVGAYEFSEDLEATTALRVIVQHGEYANAVDGDGKSLDDKTKGAGVLDLSVDYQPTPRDQLYAWARFARGNALNDVGGIFSEPYGDPLEDETTNINRSGRDHVLEAWYRHGFVLDEGKDLAIAGGLFESSEFVSENEYASDTDNQFMHEVFGYDGTDVFPAYDPGITLELEAERWSASAIYMRARNEQRRHYDYFGGRVAYQTETALGEGHYGLFAIITSPAFPNADSTRENERLRGGGISFDQAFGEILGGFVRVFYMDDNAVTDYDQMYSLGLNIDGRLWGRPQDNAGIGYAYLHGPKGSEARRSHVAEAYVRFQLTPYLDLSLDLQFEGDKLRPEGDGGEAQPPDNPRAWIPGIRASMVF